MTTTTEPTGLRNADLPAIAAYLEDERTRRYDFIAPTAKLSVQAGQLVVAGSDPHISDSGVTSFDGRYDINSVAVEGLSSKLDIPLAYLRRMQATNLPAFDYNLTSWLGHDNNAARRFMVRTLRSEDGGDGLARAFLSDRYRIVDNLDVLLATLDGVRASGANVRIDGCDLTDRNMRVRVVCEDIAVHGGALVENYRSPFTGQTGKDLPMVWAGFELSNSEVGAGQYGITPRIVFQVCANGQRMTKDVIGTRHVGGKLDDGVIRWSHATLEANLELVRNQTADAIRTFLDADYVKSKIDEMNGLAAAPVNPSTVIETVATALKYTEAQKTNILAHFISGGQVNAGGVMQAVTSAAQLEPDGDAAAALEGSAMEALRLAAVAGAA